MKTILIISTGRTGTGFFASLFGELYPDQLAAHHASSLSPAINIVANLVLDHLLPQPALRTAWMLLKKNQLADCDSPWYLDSNNHLYALPVIAPNLYPELKVIHVVRDPRDYVRSHLNWARHRPKSWIADKLVPGWQPNGWLTGDMPLRRWMRLSRFERFCWIWQFKNRYMEYIEQGPVPYLRIRFEDFFSGYDPHPILQRMTRFMDLPDTDWINHSVSERRNTSPHSSFPGWRDWSPGLCLALNELCAPLMGQYGYGNEPEWQDKLAQASHHG